MIGVRDRPHEAVCRIASAGRVAMSIFKTDDPLFDYDTYLFGRTHQVFRGPMPDLRHPYIVCLGSSHTFGRFTNYPFSSMVEQDVGKPVINFGTEGVGPGFFISDPDILHVANGAKLVIIEAMSARPLSNRMYMVRARRNERLAKPSSLLRGLYPDVDFRQFSGVAGMLDVLYETDPERFRLLENEMQNAWIGRMQSLLNEIVVPKILFWFAEREPDQTPGRDAPPKAWGYPHFVDGAMIDSVRMMTDRYVECISSEGLPQDLTQSGKPVLFQPTGRAITTNRALPSPEMHLLAADELRPAISRLLRG